MGAVSIGTAPDSWGVWYADDPRQTPWTRFLDEVVAAGYTRIELGPYGYLPTDPVQLKDELDRRGLTMTAGDGHVDTQDTVGQDMFPCPPDVPFPIVERTLAYLRSHGGGESS